LYSCSLYVFILDYQKFNKNLFLLVYKIFATGNPVIFLYVI
jgi:hypothetical protein